MPSLRQLTAAPVMFAAATVPVPFCTTQYCDGVWGCVWTAMANAVPLASVTLNVLPVIGTGVALVTSARPVPFRPVMVPLTVKFVVVQATVTPVILVVVTVPTPFVTAHVWVGALGCVVAVML